jgi:hypothetical protein
MADHFIKKKHVSNISSRSISVFLPSDEVEVSKNKPIHIGWDLNVFKPVKEQTFALSSAWAINTCQDQLISLCREVNSMLKLKSLLKILWSEKRELF